MTLTGLDAGLERGLDLAGVFVFAVSGASLAARKRFDVVGMLVLGTVTALGGGLLRDTFLGDLPPTALRDQGYLLAPLIATALVLVFDAAGLGLFSVVGSAKAISFGIAPLPALLLGVMTAVGGGVLRDVLAREVPTVFRNDQVLYAIPATIGAAATVALASRGDLSAPAALAVAVLVMAVRLAALWRGWRAPTTRPAVEP